MSDGWTGEGYSAEVGSGGGGPWLRLKKKGDKARLRLVSPPYRWVESYKDSIGKQIEAKKVAWLAIHKEIVNGQPMKSVVIFSSSAMVYGAIRALADSEDWGNPSLYDVTVERTEESPSKYYLVQPIPKGMGPLSDEDNALIHDAGIVWPQDIMASIQKSAMKDDPGHSDRDVPPPPDDDDPFAG